MIAIKHNDVFVDAEPLETKFPPGILDEKDSPEAENAARAIRILEKIIEQTSAGAATRARFSLLQSFPRLGSAISLGSEGTEEFALGDYFAALSPEWYREFISSLSQSEVEVFFKNYLVGHETWGHREGVRMLVKTILENIVHDEVPVDVKRIEGEEREIPDPEQSRLGPERRLSVIGVSMVLGNRFRCRSRQYDVLVGPISQTRLEEFQKSGWAVGTHASPKLKRLLELTEPFHLKGNVVFLLGSQGFVLGKCVLGESMLGSLS